MNKNEIGFFAEEVPEKLSFSGKEVKFNEKMFRYGAAVAAFTPEAEKTISKMESCFENEIGYLDNFISEGGAWFYKTMSDLLDFSIEQLSLNGCFSSEKETFFKQYVADKMEVTPRIYEKMKAVYDDIHEQQAKKNAERVAERKFNVANGSDELGEMLLNGVARSWDGGKNILRATEEYNNDVQEKIKQEFRYICYSMVDSFAEALWDSEKIDLRDPVPSDVYKRTHAMFENLKAGKIPASKIDEVAMDIFENNPLVTGFLDWAVIRYGDADGEMQKIADAFHISIAQTKNDLLKTTFDSLDFSSEEKTIASKKTYELEEARIHYYNEEYQKTIKKHLDDFDLLARTVDNVVYKTREEAKKAGELLDFLQKADLSTEEAALKSKKEFEEKEALLGLKIPEYENKIANALHSIDQNAKTFDGQEFATREEALDAQKQYDELKKMLRDSGFDTLDKVAILLDKLEKREFTIRQAKKVKERLLVHQEILKTYPLKNIELYKIMMFPKVKLITAVALLALMGITGSIIPAIGFLIFFIYFAFLLSLFFTTKAGLLKRAKTFEELKKYKLAAICYELAKPKSDPKYIGIEL